VSAPLVTTLLAASTRHGGTGFPVLLLHQTPRLGRISRQSALLGRDFRAIAMDTPALDLISPAPLIELWGKARSAPDALKPRAAIVGHHTGAAIGC
jgi:hypothetical protein